jgi:hypothetical protein
LVGFKQTIEAYGFLNDPKLVANQQNLDYLVFKEHTFGYNNKKVVFIKREFSVKDIRSGLGEVNGEPVIRLAIFDDIPIAFYGFT